MALASGSDSHGSLWSGELGTSYSLAWNQQGLEKLTIKTRCPLGSPARGEGSPALLMECRRTVLREVSDWQADEAGPRVERRVRLGVTGRQGLGWSQEDLVPL